MRDSEGFRYEITLKELRSMYGASGVDNDMDGELGNEVPQSIRDMVTCHDAIEALGSMIWCVI